MRTGTYLSKSRSYQIGLFDDISTGSEYDIFPFHAEWLSKRRDRKIFQIHRGTIVILNLCKNRLCLLAVSGEENITLCKAAIKAKGGYFKESQI